MALDINALVGPQSLSDGAKALPRSIADGSLAVSEIHGRYYEHTKRGNVFVASLQAAVALSTLNTTCTGFILTNPAGSGKNLAILDICIALATAPAGISVIGLAANVNTVAAAIVHTTPLTVRNCLLGSSSAGVGLADSAATLPAAPVYVRAIGGGPVATGSVQSAFIRDEVAGSLILTPGTCVSLSYLTTAISVLASFVWEENAI